MVADGGGACSCGLVPCSNYPVLILDQKRETSCQKDKTLVQKQGSGSSSVPFFWLLAV